MIYAFEDYVLDLGQRELRLANEPVAIEPQVFDLLLFLIRNRARVVSKDDLIAEVWKGRIVSESTLSSRIAAVRQAIGDSGDAQRLIRTVARKGHRFIGQVREQQLSTDAGSAKPHTSGEATPAARPGIPERRQLTVMACRIADTIDLAANLDPEDLREVMTTSRRCVEDVVLRHGGFLAERTSDGAIAYFGYPQALEEDAERAVKAGLEVGRAVGALCVNGLAKPLAARIGIATGLVVVDKGSNTSAAEPAAVGKTPLLAARLANLAAQGGVVIAGSTRHLLGTLFEYCEIDAAQLFVTAEEAAGACHVMGESGISSRFEALRSPRTRLIGREEEAELLLRRWRQVKETAQGRMVLITGEPGIGKSRLAATLEDMVRAEPHVCLRYFCSPHHTRSGLYPIITRLERAARIEREDDINTRLNKLEALLRLSSESLADDMPLFAALLSIASGERYRIPSDAPQRLKERTLNALLSQFRKLAAIRPVLMIFEDLHWIDPTSLELLLLVIEQMKERRVLLVATARPEFTPPWPSHRHISTMQLSRLDRAEAAAVIAGIASGKDMPPAVIDQIFARTDGVPLFIEELTKALLESGTLREGHNRFEIAGPLPLPASLHASLLARLDRVATVKEVAQIGSAIGREFPYALIAAIAALPEYDLQSALKQLVRAELLFQRGTPPNAKYSFKHALVQDAAYASLVRSRRQALHVAIARALEAQFPEVVAGQPEVLAHHFTAAGLAEPAAHYWQRAGQQASDRWANAEAASHYASAIDLLKKLEHTPARDREELKLQIALGAALIVVKGHGSPEVERIYLEARALCQRLGEPPDLATVLFGLWRFYIGGAQLGTSLEIGQALLRSAQRSDDRGLVVIGSYATGVSQYLSGELKSAKRHLDDVIANYKPEQRRAPIFGIGQDLGAASRNYAAICSWLLGACDLARTQADEALNLAWDLSHPFSIGFAQCLRAQVYRFRGDVSAVREQAEAALVYASEQGFPLWEALARILRGWAMAKCDEAGAVAELMGGLDQWHRTGARIWLPHFHTMLAEGHMCMGSSELALRHLSEAQECMVRTKEFWWEAEVYRLRGSMILSSKEPRSGPAEAHLLRALRSAHRQQAKSLELRAATSLACLWREQGKLDEARDLLAPIHSWFTEGFGTLDLTEAGALLAHLQQR